MCARARAFVRARVRACVRVCMPDTSVAILGHVGSRKVKE